jgi:hypothetical protein
MSYMYSWFCQDWEFKVSKIPGSYSSVIRITFYFSMSMYAKGYGNHELLHFLCYDDADKCYYDEHCDKG